MTYSKQQAQDNLRLTVIRIADLLAEFGYTAKTEGFYNRALRAAIRALYNGGDPGAFIDTLIQPGG